MSNLPDPPPGYKWNNPDDGKGLVKLPEAPKPVDGPPVPEGQQCKAKGCEARKVKHGVGRCETHFDALATYIKTNPNDPKAEKVRRALAARKRATDRRTRPNPSKARRG